MHYYYARLATVDDISNMYYMTLQLYDHIDNLTKTKVNKTGMETGSRGI